MDTIRSPFEKFRCGLGETPCLGRGVLGVDVALRVGSRVEGVKFVGTKRSHTYREKTPHIGKEQEHVVDG